MRVKRYVVDTMPDAMHSIRSELGSDAVILSTKEIRTGGFMGMFKKRKIEVVAAVETEPKQVMPEKAAVPVQSIPRSAAPQAYRQAAAAATAEKPEAARPAEAGRTYAEVAAARAEDHRQQGAVAVLAEPAADGQSESSRERKPKLNQETMASMSALYESLGLDQPPAAAPEQENDVLREIRDMKHWMERIARQASGARELPERLELLKERLLEQETDTVLVEEWIGNVFDAWDEEGRIWPAERFETVLAEQLEKFLSGRVAHGIAPDTRIVYIAGPTGVGKTTTIAKLAAEQLFKQGRKVGMITSDTYRISAVEQLRTYAAILNIPLEVVQSPGDLQRALFRLESCDLVLMDTAGRNYRNELLVAELQSLLAKELRSETFLVLSMTSKSRDMKLIAEHFGRYQLDKVIFTKLDETGSYGPLFNVLNDFPLTLSYMTNGQNVPDDLLAASGQQLTGMLLGTGGE
ncbi:flagellar biosynthesis protein FlhF [Paenibacillus donghaensis]|uniref:Flagellar biosynthesis protein FlhF n=1 Tax=Paenibacillus donghaensis TaxID=414771 RepID=A0A2Z2KEC8_9BACL|nr:flagellar biosynthesis protein FlhF [Paenibacillus donghaensis]ASA22245.1 flagellar biosynthesis protein FlhF [Paenibacillus donghaensis]